MCIVFKCVGVYTNTNILLIGFCVAIAKNNDTKNIV